MDQEFRIIEVYTIGGQKRYRVKVGDTNIVVNVAAASEEEAINNARRILENLKLNLKT
ncbi:MAG: hypothetical protein F7C38_04295 [Desulfurococcales archaeon]|nr:hypothetical protein [Desulfurococcales archaeon]